MHINYLNIHQSLFLLIIVAVFLFPFYGMGDEPVYVAGIPPIAGVLDRLTLEDENVDIVGGSSSNPHTFDVSPSQLQQLVTAQFFFHTHFPFELKIVNVLGRANTRVRCIDVTQGIIWRKAEMYIHTNHLHNEGENENDKDLHCWLSPENLKIISKHIYNSLIIARPEKKDEYTLRYEKWLEDIDKTDSQIKQMLQPYRGKSFFVYHPSFSYFAEAYGIHEVCIETEGKKPSAKQLNAIIRRMREEGTHVIFVQPQFDVKWAETIGNAVNARVEIMNDIERDVLQNLLNIGEKIRLSFETSQK